MTSKERLFQLFTTRLLKKILTCCFEGWFFQLEIMSSSSTCLILTAIFLIMTLNGLSRSVTHCV